MKADGMVFALQVTAFREKALSRLNSVKRGVALRLFKAVIMDTPVLSGRLRANWQCSLNVPLRALARFDDPQGSLAIAAAASVISGSVLSDAIILTNSLPYAHRIEFDGWSHTKAPAGMVRVNFSRFKELLGDEATLVYR